MIEIEKKTGPLNPQTLDKKYFTKDSMNIEYRKRQMFEVNKTNRVFTLYHFINFIGNATKITIRKILSLRKILEKS